MAKLKGVIFGWDNVLVSKGKLAPQKAILDECGKLVRFLNTNKIEIVVLTNHDYFIVNSKTNERTPAKDYFEKAWGVPLDCHVCARDGGAGKQSAAGLGAVLAAKGWKPYETVYVGNTDADMQAAVNSKILLLNAQWYQQTMDYGFPFKEPKQVARFIDVLCLRDHEWAYRVEDGSLAVYSLATFSTMYEPFVDYSKDFLANIKSEYGHDEEFWAKYLCSSLYFSGIYENVNYITSYPCHSKGDFPEVLNEPVTRFAKCFRANYIPDLVLRHTTATKSQTNRDTVDHQNQLNTICLNPKPTKRLNELYAKSPLKPGKTVLVIDDVCSKGMSFEAARAYLNSTGCTVISVALLKALKHGYQRLAPLSGISPYKPSIPNGISVQKSYSYGAHVMSDTAAKQLRDRLRRYKAWEWPKGI